MNIRFLKFFFDEKDVFLLIFLIIVSLASLFNFSLDPFNNRSLIVIGLFALFTRSLVSAVRYDKYFYIMIIALFLSLFFSPYTVGLYLTIALIWYSKTV
ncbi:MAG: hypothetical protein KatS3mg090_0574 [Patescibacteria group bacterium]|nr:MAG: hypothetical protein KatS3mg090_0574 [Patescibacteria group bacterium]